MFNAVKSHLVIFCQILIVFFFLFQSNSECERYAINDNNNNIDNDNNNIDYINNSTDDNNNTIDYNYNNYDNNYDNNNNIFLRGNKK